MDTSPKPENTTKSRVRHPAAKRAHARESFNAEALTSWQAYRDSGRHLSAQEATEWLDSWGSNTEAKRPECHT